jgi:hypothetical protein
MASQIKWTTLGASTLVASAEFDSLADEGNVAGSLVAASQNTYSDWFLHLDNPGTAPSGHIELYFVTQFAGSTIDGGSAIDPQPTALVGNFSMREATAAQNMGLGFLLVPNQDFTPVLINKANVTLSGSLNFLYFQQYNENPDG